MGKMRRKPRGLMRGRGSKGVGVERREVGHDVVAKRQFYAEVQGARLGGNKLRAEGGGLNAVKEEELGADSFEKGVSRREGDVREAVGKVTPAMGRRGVATEEDRKGLGRVGKIK